MENEQTTMGDWKGAVVGTEDHVKLQPKDVRILSMERVSVQGTKKPGTTYAKIVFTCKHPDRDDAIEISDVKFIVADKVEARATWYTLDSQNKLAKNSGLAAIMQHYGAGILQDLVGKTVKTALDDRGYLCLKAY